MRGHLLGGLDQEAGDALVGAHAAQRQQQSLAMVDVVRDQAVELARGQRVQSAVGDQLGIGQGA